jgi:glucosylceramidase
LVIFLNLQSAKRISSVASRSQLTTSLNQDGKVVTVVMNESDVEVKYKCIGTKATEILFCRTQSKH